MEALLKLKTGIDSLNKKEFMSMINNFDKNYLTNIIFKHFHFELNNAKSLSHINNQIVPEIQAMNDKVAKIIVSRENKIYQLDHDDTNISVDNDKESESVQLDILPSVMISSISSFLAFKDVLNFEKCNKSIFIGTRSPISVYQLSSAYSNKLIKFVHKTGNIFHWNRFKSIKALKIDGEEQWGNISHLSSLEFIDIPWISQHITLPNRLKGIAADYIRRGAYIPENIESLHLQCFSVLDDDHTKCNNLKEICVQYPNQEEIDLLNKQNLDNVERVNLCYPFADDINMESMLLLLSQSCINCISIKEYAAIQIMKVLNKTLKGILRKTMKIRLHCDEKSVFVDELKGEITELIDSLKKQTNDFMVIGEFRIKQQNEIDFDDSTKLDLLIHSKIEDMNDNEDKIWKFVIKNKECQMNEYEDKWLMRCSRCRQSDY